MLKCYSRVTGFNRLPQDREYWSLCNIQSPDESLCELEHLTQSAFISQHQYHGVDWGKHIIENNKQNYPAVGWYHGEWYTTLFFNDLSKVGFVHLDTTYFANSDVAWKMAANTMALCPTGTFIGINVINAAYAQKCLDTHYVAQLSEYIGVEQLNWDYIADFTYPGSKRTVMHTFMLRKK
jgi:hypothetical protein